MGIYDKLEAGTRHRVHTPDGLEVEVREWGDPCGPPILLVPGLAQSYLSFAAQVVSPLLKVFRLVSFDPRGHGLSEASSDPEAYLGRRWSDEVQAVIDSLSLHRPILAGWSLGGRIVRQYLIDYGDTQLSGLGFISARPVEVPEVLGAGNNVIEALDPSDLVSRIRVARAFLANCFQKQPEPDDFVVMMGFNMLCSFEVRGMVGKWLTEPDRSRAALRAVTVPTHIVHGSSDVLVLPTAGQMTEGLIPHAELHLHEGCGHSVFFEDADRFNADFAAFARGVFAGERAA